MVGRINLVLSKIIIPLLLQNLNMSYQKAIGLVAVCLILVSRGFAAPPASAVITTDFTTAIPSLLMESGFNTNHISEKNFNNEVLLVVLDVLGNERFAKVEISEKHNIIEGEDLSQTLSPGFYYILASNDFAYDNKRMFVK